MGAAVELRDHLMPLDSERGLELITDLARYAEGLLDEAAVKKMYRFSDEDWDRMGSNDELVEKIQAEKTRRIRNGSSARERAQTLFAEAPAVLGTILHGDDVSPRHKIESARELRAIAANGPEATAPETRFIISIDLGGGEVLRFNKSIECNAHDVDPDNPDTNIDTDGDTDDELADRNCGKKQIREAAVANLFERLAQSDRARAKRAIKPAEAAEDPKIWKGRHCGKNPHRTTPQSRRARTNRGKPAATLTRSRRHEGMLEMWRIARTNWSRRPATIRLCAAASQSNRGAIQSSRINWSTRSAHARLA